MNLLAVEDDRAARLIYEALAARYGFEVVVVNSCEGAMEALSQNQFDVIVMDWELCGVDGLVCTRRIRKIQSTQGLYIPIIGVTAHAMDEHRDACLRAGMDDYLSKPFHLDVFYELLLKWQTKGLPPAK